MGGQKWSQQLFKCRYLSTDLSTWWIDHGRYLRLIRIYLLENTVDIDGRCRFTYGELRSSVDGRLKIEIILWLISSTTPVENITGVVDEINHKIISIFNRSSTIDRNSPWVNRHRPSISTLFSSRWILIDRQYWPWLIDQVDKSVDRYRHFDSFRSISDHPCDHDFCVDVCQGPFLITYGTIWDHRSVVLFFLTSRKNAAGPKGQAWKRHTSKRKWAVAPKRPGYSLNNFSAISTPPWNTLDSVSIVHFVSVFVSSLCVVLREALEIGLGQQKWASESIIYIFLSWSMGEWGQCSRFFWVHVHFDSQYRPSTDSSLVWEHVDGQYGPIFFGYESTSTVDFDRFFAEIDGRCDIDRIFK